MRTLKNILLLVAATLLGGCIAPPRPAPAPLELRIAVNDIYCTDTACSCVADIAARTYPATLDELRVNDLIILHFDYFIDTYQLEDAIRSGEYDGVLAKPWLALRMQKETGISFERIVDVLDPDNNRWLSGSVIVPVDSPLQSMEELDGKHIFIGEEDGYEKHQAALRLFKERGIHPAKIDTHSSCGENIGELLDGNGDAAVISDYALIADCAVDYASPEDFRTLEHTERIPLTSLMLDINKVSPDQAARLKKALLTLSGKHASETLLGNGFIEPAPWNPPELEEL